MATIPIVGGAFKIDGVNAYILPGGAGSPVSTKVIQIVGAALVGLSITVKARVVGSSATPVAIAYRKRYLNGAVGDETSVSTAITTDSLIEVNSAGVDVVLDVTALTSGTATVTTKDLLNR